MATDTTHLPQGELTADSGVEITAHDGDFGGVQLAAATGNAGEPLDLPQGQRVVLIPVRPGQSLTLPTDSADGLLAKIGPEGNLAIVVDGRVIIFQGYVAANEQAPVRILTTDGEEIDAADLVAATDPNLDIQTAAGPAAGDQGDATGSGIFTPFVPGEGPGLIGAEGVLGATALQYKLIDDERRVFTTAEDTVPTNIDIKFDNLEGVINEDDLFAREREQDSSRADFVLQDVANQGVGNDPFDTGDREPGSQTNPPDDDAVDNNGTGVDDDREPLQTVATVTVTFGDDIPGTLKLDTSELPEFLFSEGEPVVYEVQPAAGGQGNGIVAFVDGDGDGKFNELFDRKVFDVKVQEEKSDSVFHVVFTLYDNLDNDAPDANGDNAADLLGADEQILGLPVKVTATDSDGSSLSAIMKLGVEDDIPFFGQVNLTEGSGGILLTIDDSDATIVHDETKGVDGDADDVSKLDAGAYADAANQKVAEAGFSLPYGDSEGATKGIAMAQVLASFGADGATQEHYKDAESTARNSIFGELEDRTNADNDGANDGENERPFELFMIATGGGAGATPAEDDLDTPEVEGNLTIADQKTNATVTWNGQVLSVYLHQVDAQTIIGYVVPEGQTPEQAAAIAVDNGQEAVFVLTIDDSGVLTFVQYHQINHDIDGDNTNGEHDDTFQILGEDGTPVIQVRITDYDGDHATQPVVLQVQDDGPKFCETKFITHCDIDLDWTIVNGEVVGSVDEDWLKGGNKGLDFAPGDNSPVDGVSTDGVIIFSFGTDKPGTLSIAGLKITDSKGDEVPLDSLTTADGRTVQIEQSEPDSDGIITYRGFADDGEGGTIDVFTFTIDTAGDNIGAFEFTLLQPLEHEFHDADSNNDGPQTRYEDDLLFDFTIVGTDVDGDTATGHVKVNVDDDVPVVVNNYLSSFTLRTDETVGGNGDVNANGSGSKDGPYAENDENLVALPSSLTDPAYGAVIGAGVASTANLFIVNGGGDGAFSSVFTLNITGGGNTGLVDTATGQPVTLVQNGSVIEGRNASGDVVLALTIDAATGEVSMAQYRAINHSDDQPSSYPDEIKSILDGKLSVTLTVTDNDGDVASATRDISGGIKLEDDGPSVTLVSGATISLNLDETVGGNGTDLDTYHPDGKEDGPTIENDEALVGSLPTSITSYGTVIGADVAQASALFSYNPGSDGEAFHSYNLVFKSGADTGLIDVATGQAVKIYDGSGTLYGVNTNGDFVFAISIDHNTGEVKIGQFRAIDHGDEEGEFGAPDEMLAIKDGVLSVELVVTDKDGDVASVSKDIGSSITFDDDGPKAELVTIGIEGKAGDGMLVHDETTGDDGNDDLAGPLAVFAGVEVSKSLTAIGYAQTVVNVDLSGGTGNPNAAYGSDGAGSTALALTGAGGSTLFGTATNLTDTATGQPIFLFAIGNGIVLGVLGNDPNGTVAFALALDNAGTLSLAQYRALEHPEAGDTASGKHDDALTLLASVNGEAAVYISALVTDRDGDTVRVSVPLDGKDGNGAIVFEDDGPSTDLTLGSGASLVLDESAGTPAIDQPLDPNANDEAGNVDGDIGYATISAGALFSESTNFGTDGKAAADDRVFSLVVNGADSGLVDSESDQTIVLVDKGNGVVEGHVGAADGALSFTVTVNVATGDVTVSQVRAVEHGNPADGDEAATPEVLNSNTLLLKLTVTDGDGDTASDTIDLGSIIRFEDDAPIARDDVDTIETADAGATFFAAGNVISGAGVVIAGIDDGGSDKVAGISKLQYITQDSDPAGGFVANGVFGILTMDAAGNYTYDFDEANWLGKVPSGAKEIFTYTYTDSDGDSDTATLTINMGDATVSTSAVVNPGGASFIKEDVQTPVALTATPGAGDRVTQIVLDDIPAGWTVNQGGITLSSGTLGAVTLVGDTLTINITGAAPGVAVTATVPVTPAEDSDVDGNDLVVQATVVDGVVFATNSATFDVTVDAILDEYLDVTAGAIAPLTESASQQVVGLNLSSAFAATPYANALAGGSDGDGSEWVPLTVQITVSGDVADLQLAAPIAGVTLGEGAPGTWLLNADSLANLQSALATLQAIVPAGFDGTIGGSILAWTRESNTPQGSIPASGNEPVLSDNVYEDRTDFSIVVTPSTTVTTSAVVGTQGAAYLKEDVYGPIALTATPGATDHVTQIVLSNIPAGWDVKTGLGDIVLSSGTLGVVTFVGGVLTINVTGAADGVAITATIQVKANEDSDVDGLNLNVAATVVDGDGGESASNSSNFNVTVDAILDQYLDVTAGAIAPVAEGAASQVVGLNLSSAFAATGFANALAGGIDTDGSEQVVLSVTVNVTGDVADLQLAAPIVGVTLTEGAPGSWTLQADTLANLQSAISSLQAIVPAGFDGIVSGSIVTTTTEANTPQGSVPASGQEPVTSDNVATDTTAFSFAVRPDTTVTASALVGTQGAAYLKEDVYGPIALTATPGATDRVTQIVLSNIPDGWDVKDASLADFTIAGGTIVGTPVFDEVTHSITFDISGAALGVPVTVTIQVRAAEDSDVDGINLHLAATAVDGDGGETAFAGTDFNVVVDAVLDRYLDVSQSAPAIATESGGSQAVNLNLTSALAGGAGNPFANSDAGGADDDNSENLPTQLIIQIAAPNQAIDLTLAAGAPGGVTLTEFAPDTGVWFLNAANGLELQLAMTYVQAVVPAGFDGIITGTLSATTSEANTPQGTVPASGNEPDTGDNSYNDLTNFSITVNPSTTVTTSAVVGTQGAAYLKEDVYGPIALTATPGATDHVTQIVLSNIPAGWDVKTGLGDIVLSSGTLGVVTFVGGVLTINVTGAADGVAITATVQVKANEDSDVDGLNLNVAATVVDGAASASNSSSFNVTVDAILDQYLNVTAGGVAAQTESASQQVVGLNLSSAFATTAFANALAGGADTDGSEQVILSVTITISGDAANLQLGSAVPNTSLTEGPAGTWTLTSDSVQHLQDAIAALQAIVPAGFDGTITGSISVTTEEDNTSPTLNPASGNEPVEGDNRVIDLTNFSITVNPSTTVTTSAVVGTQGAAYLKEDVYGPIALTATPGATDHVTQIVLSNIPAGWDVKTGLGDIVLSSGTLGVVTFVGGVLTINVTGAADGVAITATVQVKANEDSDVDGANLNVAATVVDNDGGESASNNSNFDVTVDAILDQYLDVTAAAIADRTESGAIQFVTLNLSSAFATTPFANALAGGADGDGSEKVQLTATITVAGDAVNLTMVGGIGGVSLVEGPAGTWTLTAPDLASLQLALPLVQAVVPAGFDGTVTGSISITTEEDNTNPTPNPLSGNEPDQTDNRVTDITNFTFTVKPDTTVTTSAVVGTQGAAFLKEDVYGPIALTATPGATDHVTQIVLSNVPAGWDVKDDSIADFQITGGTFGLVPVYDSVAHTITFLIQNSVAGVPVTVTVLVKGGEDSDVDGLNLNVAATAVDNDGVTSVTNNSNFNVTVDAILDQYVDVTAGGVAAQTESGVSQVVGLNLSSSIVTAPFANALQGGADGDGSELRPMAAQITVANTAIDLSLSGGFPLGTTLAETAPNSGIWILTASSPADLQTALTHVQAVIPAGFDGFFNGTVAVTTLEKNTPPTSTEPASGNEPVTSDNAYTDSTPFIVEVKPSTTVETSAVVGTQGAAFLKEDVYAPIALTATPGATDIVTQILLSDVPAGWDVKDDSLADFQIVGGTIIGTPVYDAVAHVIVFNIAGAAVGVPVTVTVQVKANEDSDVDGLNLNVAASAVDADGGENTANNSSFNVTVDAILDQYLDVTAGGVAAQTESGSQQVVGLNLSSAFATTAFANALAGGADTDGSEKVILSVTITVSGDAANLQLGSAVPNTSLAEGPAGTWTLTSDSVAHLQDAIAALQAVVPAGFDGTITGSISVTTEEDNTLPTPNGLSGNEPDQNDNRVVDLTNFSITVNPSTTVTTSAVVGTQGAAYLKEDVYGPIALTATPGATDHVTQIVLSNIPAGWDVKTGLGDIVLSSGTLGVVTFVGGVLTINVTGAADGAAITATIQVKANEDSDVDGANLNVAATVVDNDGGESASNNSNFDVTVDAILDQYLDVTQAVVPVSFESTSQQIVGFNLSSAFATSGFTNALAGGSDGDGSEKVILSVTITIAGDAANLQLGSAVPNTSLTEGPAGTWTLVSDTTQHLQDAIAALQAIVPAGFDGNISGSISVVTEEDNTAPTLNPLSGNEPDQTDNRVTDVTPFSIAILPSTTVNTSAIVGTGGIGYLKEDVTGPIALVATPGGTDHVTQIVLGNIPAGWTVDTSTITLSSGALGSVTLVANVLTINVIGAGDGVPVTATVQVTPAADSDVDGSGLTVSATAVDGVNSFTNAPVTFNVTVDAILDQYVDVSQTAQAIATESGSSQNVFLNLTSAIVGAGGNPFANSMAGGADTDNSEVQPTTATITVPNTAIDLVLSGAPGGTSLVETAANSGVWTLTVTAPGNLQAALAAVQAVIPAGFDGTVTGQVSVTTQEANTPQGTVLGSGLEPDTGDNSKTDLTDFSVRVNPDTTVTTSAIVGTGGVGYLKEDVQGPIALVANPGDTDTVTQIVLSGVPNGWTLGSISLSSGTVGSSSFVGGVLTINVSGAAVGATITATVQVTPAADSDVDGSGLTVKATVVDGVNSFTNAPVSFDVPVDAVLDQYVDVSQSAVPTATESGASQNVGLNLTSAIVGSAGNPFTHSFAGGAGADGDNSEIRPVSASITVPNTAIDLVLGAGAPGSTTLVETAPNSGVWTLTATNAANLQTALGFVQAVVPAGFDGTITGSITVVTEEDNTSPTLNPLSGGEPDQTDNRVTDTTSFSVTVNPSTTVTTSAEVGTVGAAFLKEDVFGPVKLTATPGATDHVTQIVLSGVPAGWDVKDDSNADFTVVGGTLVGSPVYNPGTGTITFNLTGTTDGVAVSITVQMKAAPDSDVDGANLNVAATVVDNDGGESTSSNSNFNVTVDAILDEYLNVTAGAIAAQTESGSNQAVGLNLSSAFATTAFANALAGGSDTDGSEKVILSVTITITGDAANLQLSSAVTNTTLTEGVAGTWTLTSDSVAHLQEAITKLQAIVPAGFDGTINGSIAVTTEEDNTSPTPNGLSGNEPIETDNRVVDNTSFSITVNPSTTVTTSAVVGTVGAAFLKEDVFGPVKLTATPGATDHVTQIVLSGVPAGWDVKDDSNADFTVVGGTLVGSPVYNPGTGTITFNLTGTTDGVAVSITVQMKAAADSDVDGLNLNVAATAVDGDGGETTSSNSNFNVVVDAVLDQFVDVNNASKSVNEAVGTQNVLLDLTSALTGSSGNPFTNSFAGGAGADGDSSEKATVQITVNGPANTAGVDLVLVGAPAGAQLTETSAGSGIWNLTANSIADVQTALTKVAAALPAGFDGTVSGTVTATTFEANTPPGSVAPLSGTESDVADNTKSDAATYNLTVQQVNVPDANPDANNVAQGSNTDYQLMLVVDISGSMGDSVTLPDGTTTTRMALQQAALINLLNSYVASTTGTVEVKIVTFSNGATYFGGSSQTTFLNVSNAATLAALTTAINGLAPTNNTDYDTALATAQLGIMDASWDATTASKKGLVYFFSDGQPVDDGDGSSSYPGGSTANSLDQTEENLWEGRASSGAYTSGLADKGVVAIAVGLGQDIANNASALEQLGRVAYYNETFQDSSVIVVADENQLTNEVIQTVPSSVVGNLLVNDTGGPDGYGAPIVTAATLIDDGDSDLLSTVTNATTITITTNNGVLVINRVTGDYTYTAKPGSGGKVDSFNYTIQDATGDTDSSTLTITITAPVMVTGTSAVNGNGTGQFYIGDDANNTVNAAGGNDSIQGGYGNDVLNGDDGDDSVYGQEGNDTLQGGIGNDLVSGGNGNDTVGGGTGNDTVQGGFGDDNVTGGTGNDTLEGGLGNDIYVLTPGDGTDTIADVGGTDTIQINGTVGAFSALMVGDDIVIDYGTNGLTDHVTLINHFTGNNNIETLTIAGGPLAGTYTISTDDSGTFRGTDGNADLVVGNNNDNTLSGGSSGGSGGGNDLLAGGGGNDTLIGGDGDDLLIGGAGNDTYTLSTSNNDNDTVFVTSALDGKDVVQNFGNSGNSQDFINLDMLFDSLGVASADRSGRVDISTSGGDTLVKVDINGGGGFNDGVDLLITLSGVTSGITKGTAATDDVQLGTL